MFGRLFTEFKLFWALKYLYEYYGPTGDTKGDNETSFFDEVLQRPQRFKLFTTYLINSKWKEEYKDTLETVLVQGHGLNSVTQENFETTKLKFFFSYGII